MPIIAIVEAKRLVEELWRDTSRWDKNLIKAQQILEQALQSNQDDLALLTGLGTVLCDRARYEEATVVLGKAIRLGSIDRNTHYAMAVATFNTEGHSVGLARFQAAAKLEPSADTWEAYFDPQAQ